MKKIIFSILFCFVCSNVWALDYVEVQRGVVIAGPFAASSLPVFGGDLVAVDVTFMSKKPKEGDRYNGYFFTDKPQSEIDKENKAESMRKISQLNVQYAIILRDIIQVSGIYNQLTPEGKKAINKAKTILQSLK